MGIQYTIIVILSLYEMPSTFINIGEQVKSKLNGKNSWNAFFPKCFSLI